MDPIKKIKHHKFHGKVYKFHYDKLEKHISRAEINAVIRQYKPTISKASDILALTDVNTSCNKMIVVRDDIEKENPKELLKVLIDEALHALDSSIDNDVVDEYAQDLSSFLWRCGYRRIKSEDALNNIQKSEEE